MKAVLMTAVGDPQTLKYEDIKEPEILKSTQLKTLSTLKSDVMVYFIINLYLPC